MIALFLGSSCLDLSVCKKLTASFASSSRLKVIGAGGALLELLGFGLVGGQGGDRDGAEHCHDEL